MGLVCLVFLGFLKEILTRFFQRQTLHNLMSGLFFLLEMGKFFPPAIFSEPVPRILQRKDNI